MRNCNNCGISLTPEKEFIFNDRTLCEDCCMEERIPYARKPAWQYIRSVKSEYLIPSPQHKKDHKAYIDYYFDHLEEFKDAPCRTTCGTMQLRMIQEGRISRQEAERRTEKRRKRWVDYHQAKADALGYKIKLDQLDWDMSGIVRELEAINQRR